MAFVRILAAAALSAGTLVGATSVASAQYYPYQQPQQRYYYPQYQQAPTYVPPRILRKQAQQRQRFIEKYGYQQSAPQYYYPQARQRYVNPGQLPYGYERGGVQSGRPFYGNDGYYR